MSFLTPVEILHTIAWFIALIELVVALYVLLLNAWHTANRHMSALLLVFAVNSFGLGLLIKAGDIGQTALPTFLLAMTSEPVKLGLLIIAVVLFKPEWLRGRWRWVLWVAYAIFFLPMVLSVVDAVWNVGLWNVGLDPQVYTSGYVGGAEYVKGSVAQVIRLLYAYVFPLLAFIPLVSAAVNRESSREARRLAWILTVIQAVVIVMVFGLRPIFSALFGLDENLAAAASLIATSTFFAMAYAYAAFMQMISERRVQRGRLQPRLTSLMLIVTIPTVLAIAAFVITRSVEMLRAVGFEKLTTVNLALSANVDLWVDNNVKTLQNLVRQSEIVMMEADAQTPILEAVDALDEDIYLVSTTNLDGVNVARSDGAPPKDYSDRLWFTAVKDGAPLAFQTLVGRTSGEPALVMSMPVHDERGVLVGVGMFATDLDALADEIAASRIGETGIVYVVDAENHIIAHPDPVYAAELKDASQFPAVAEMREQSRGTEIVVDEAGERWYVAFAELDNGWGVVVEQKWDELRRPLFRLGTASFFSLLFGGLMLITLTYFTMRQAFMPINSLTETATAIAGGDLTREAPVESEDELGTLARTFNRMTAQLRELINSLEQRVSARTFDLEQRSAALEASAAVSRAASSILDTDVLITRVVDLIRERFGLYYVGLFLVDEAREWAVLQSGTGAAGRAMLARHHRIRIGEGMIGWCVENSEARIALIAEEDAVRLTNPELPETRSEAALPLRSRGRVLGALTVQSAQPDAFDENMLTVLQTMADQVAVAIDNARLYSSAQQALEAERRAYGVRMSEAWQVLAQARTDWGYIATRQADSAQLAVVEPEGGWHPEMQQAQTSGHRVLTADASVVAIPIRARDRVIGVLRFDRGSDGAPWSDEDVDLLETLTDQLGQTLERAQLYEDSQRRAAREQLIGEVTGRMREPIDLEDVLQVAVRQMRQALNLNTLSIRLRAPEDGGAPGSETPIAVGVGDV